MEKNQMSKSASRILIQGEGRDEWGQRYFKFAVRGVRGAEANVWEKTNVWEQADIPPFSAKQIMDPRTELFGELANAGAGTFMATARHALLRRLDNRPVKPFSFKVVSRLGWNSGAFVLPGKVTGKPAVKLEPTFRHLDQQQLAKYRVKGTLRDWQTKIGQVCSGNSRLMFCASLGLTGPILPLVGGPRSGGFQLFGPAEVGKTGAAMVTGSIWGCHRSSERRENGFAESWHTTAGKVEITALAHNQTVLVLDETKRAARTDNERAQVVVDVSFGLAEGVERERLTNPGSVRGWQLYFLSTSNFSLAELAQLGSVQVDDAVRGRVVDIPKPEAGHGIYENLHRFSDGQKFTDTLKVRCRKFCGSAGQAFVRKLVAERQRDLASCKKFLKHQRATYLTALKKRAEAENLRPLNRASGRFATVFAAGSLAIKYRIFLWGRADLLRAILTCQLDGLRSVNAAPLATTPLGFGSRQKLLTYLRERRSDFLDLRRKMPRLNSHKFGSVPGYVAKFKGKQWLYLTADQLRGIIGRGEDAKRLMDELLSEGLLARGSSRKFLVQRPIYSAAKGNKGYRWVHAIRLRILKG